MSMASERMESVSDLIEHSCTQEFAHESHVWISVIAGGGDSEWPPQLTLWCPGLPSYPWGDPDRVQVETTTYGLDGSITRSTRWVSREDFFGHDETPPAQP
jgi:hypothetical protein